MSKDIHKDLDSLFRFYGSQIAAHSNYLVAYAIALVVFLYRLIDRIREPAPLAYDFALGIIFGFFIFLGIWLYGRLLYYTELSNTVQSFMGLSSPGRKYMADYKQLVQKELNANHGLANIVVDSLFWRISSQLLLKEVDNETFRKVTENTPISKGKALGIALANSIWIYDKRYRNMLKRFFILTLTGELTSEQKKRDV